MKKCFSQKTKMESVLFKNQLISCVTSIVAIFYFFLMFTLYQQWLS
jgi:hypothetical protein